MEENFTYKILGDGRLIQDGTLKPDGSIELIDVDDTRELKSNKVTSISSSSTNDQYPSAKCVYDLVGSIESVLQEIRGV